MEQIKTRRSIYDAEIIKKIMEKVKDVSDVIPYNDLKIKYFNIYPIYPFANNNKKKKSTLNLYKIT